MLSTSFPVSQPSLRRPIFLSLLFFYSKKCLPVILEVRVLGDFRDNLLRSHSYEDGHYR